MKQKNHFLTLLILLFGMNGLMAQINPQLSSKKVQVAILFDTSNSMDGLIDQAKSRIWNIVNEVNTLRYEGKIPQIEIALYEYGKSSLALKDNYIRKITDLSSDLDVLSKELFALTTNGGDEFCGAVIKASLDDLKWSSDLSDLKMIYIAGNEPFTQGPIAFQEVCARAKKMGIFVNTIYCGNYDDGVREGWKNGATCSDGEFFNINSDNQIVHIATPYDDKIGVYSDSLNQTYFGYGQIGASRKMQQVTEDENASQKSVALNAERAKTKASFNYNNGNWDIVDGVDNGTVDFKTLKDDDLPVELKGKTIEEKEAFIAEQKKKREAYQKKIQELSVERENYIAEERKKMSETEILDDFGTKVNEGIKKRALENGYIKVTE